MLAKDGLFNLIPDELKRLDRWVVWKFVARKGQPGKFAKKPFDAKTGLPASCHDRATWSSYGVAVRAFQTGLYNGIGFQLGDGYVGVDIDHCRDRKTGAMDPMACEIVRAFSSYSEVSPSGKGCKIFIKGNLPEGPRVRNMGAMKIEIYGSGRYFTTTGRRFRQMSSEVKDCEETFIRVYKRLFKRRGSEKPITVQPLRNSNASSIEEEISRIRLMSDNSRLKRLWNGAQSGYASQSEADLALCAMLVLHFGCDAALIDSLFRRSKLFRPKWDEVHSTSGRTYGRMTIAKAIATASREYSVLGRRSSLPEIFATVWESAARILRLSTAIPLYG